jgi:hypothetical protein
MIDITVTLHGATMIVTCTPEATVEVIDAYRSRGWTVDRVAPFGVEA